MTLKTDAEAGFTLKIVTDFPKKGGRVMRVLSCFDCVSHSSPFSLSPCGPFRFGKIRG